MTVSLLVERGVLAGFVWLRDRRYALRPSTVGLLLGETRSEYWRTHPEVEPEGHGPAAAIPALRQANATASLTRGGWDYLCQGPPPEGQHVIDVLVLYTQRVLDTYGDQAGVLAKVQLAITAANTVLRNSGINSIAYSLRGVEFLPDSDDYDEQGIVTGLENPSGWRNLQEPPYYVQQRRTTLWADVVALARRGSDGTCGLAFIQRGTTQGCIYEPGTGFEDYAYMIFDPECDADRLNFAHELGHLLGVEHDPRNSPSLTTSGFQSCPWSFAHRHADATEGFRTLMAYADPGDTTIPGTPCNNDTECALIDAFSTPALEWSAAGGIQPQGTVPGAEAIGVVYPPPGGRTSARATDTLLRLAPFTAAFQPRPDDIFSHGFQN